MEKFPQQIPTQENREDKKPPRQIKFPHQLELTRFWPEINMLDRDTRNKTIRKQFAPYTGGVFHLEWHGHDGPQHEEEYIFHGVDTEKGKGWFYQLENTKITARFQNDPGGLINFRMNSVSSMGYDPAFPTLSLDRHNFSNSNGGPTAAWIEKPLQKAEYIPIPELFGVGLIEVSEDMNEDQMSVAM